ncbi:MAG: hypothetical protein HY963_00250 [Ignavibacteriales bacterium]|nr:hypothetical protein [Ignavibacteriales bacterium]
MKNIKRLLLLLLFVLTSHKTWGDSLYVYPSFYYTFGKYSTGGNSNSIAGYATLSFNGKSFVTLGYDNLNIEYTTGKYLQQNHTFSYLQNLFPSYLKVSYSYIGGKYTQTGQTSSSFDNTHLISLEYFFYSNMFYLGLAASYIKQSGYTQLNVYQITPRIEWILSNKVYLSTKPNYTYVSDQRNLFSVAGYISWNSIQDVYLKLGGFVGKRAFYFDTDLLTIYNQNETQTNLFTAQMDYIPSKYFKLTAGYQHTNFTGYSIDYFILGIRTAIKF